jgi:hypothetical protein
MRRFHLGLATVALPVFALTLFLAGCGKDEKKPNTDTAGNVPAEPSKADLKPVESKGGVLKGKIALKGSPNLDDLTKKLQADIAAKADQKDYCMKGSESEITEQQYRIGDNKQLGNVFVWIMPDTGTYFKVSKDQLEDAKKSPVVIRQPHCAFIPHCAVLFSQYRDAKGKLQPTGQVLEVKNDATISHNTNWKGGAKNPGDNVLVKADEKRDVTNLVPEASPVTIKCNIHGWMDAYLRVVDTPYYAISLSDTLDKDKVKKDDAKFGTYTIKNLPVGKVKVLAWHEKVGWLNKGEGKGEVIDIAEGKETEKNFEGEAK